VREHDEENGATGCGMQDYLRIEAEATPMREGERGQDSSGGPPLRPRLKNTQCFHISVSIRACARGVTKTQVVHNGLRAPSISAGAK
jgi:hypothetical protein